MIIDDSLICLELEAENKEEVFERIFAIVGATGRLSDVAEYANKVKQREEDVSTDMGFGIAVPHGKTDAVLEPFIMFAKLKEAIIWNEVENSEVDLIFLLGVPETNKDNLHLKIMSQLASKLVDEEFLSFLRLIKTKQQFFECFKDIKI